MRLAILALLYLIVSFAVALFAGRFIHAGSGE
jgi:hypothetical protein